MFTYTCSMVYGVWSLWRNELLLVCVFFGVNIHQLWYAWCLHHFRLFVSIYDETQYYFDFHIKMHTYIIFIRKFNLITVRILCLWSSFIIIESVVRYVGYMSLFSLSYYYYSTGNDNTISKLNLFVFRFFEFAFVMFFYFLLPCSSHVFRYLLLDVLFILLFLNWWSRLEFWIFQFEYA